jgi:hypothetical protein
VVAPPAYDEGPGDKGHAPPSYDDAVEKKEVIVSSGSVETETGNLTDFVCARKIADVCPVTAW